MHGHAMKKQGVGYELMFFTTHGASFYRETLRGSFSRLSLRLIGAYFTASSRRLKGRLASTFGGLGIIFIINKLKFSSRGKVGDVVSHTLYRAPIGSYGGLGGRGNSSKCIIETTGRVLVLLPSRPRRVRSVVRKPLEGCVVTGSMVR